MISDSLKTDPEVGLLTSLSLQSEAEHSLTTRLGTWFEEKARPQVTTSCQNLWTWLTETDDVPQSETESCEKSVFQKCWQWLTTSGDPRNIRPERWKRIGILNGAFIAYVVTRQLTTDAQLVVNASTFFTVQAHAELYDRSRLAQMIFLTTVTGATWAAHRYLYPDVHFLTEAALPALSGALAWRTATLATQAWMNKKAVLRA